MLGINMETKNELVKILSEEFGNNAILTRKDIINCLDAKGMLEPVNSAGAMTRFLGQSGFEKVESINLFNGIVEIHIGYKI